MNWIKRNWDALIAFLLIWIAPLVLVLVQGIHFLQNGEKHYWKIEVYAMFILAILLIVYVKKIRKLIERKLLASEFKGGKTPLLVLIRSLFTIVSFIFLCLLISTLESFMTSIFSYVVLVTISVSIGCLFNFIHALRMAKE